MSSTKWAQSSYVTQLLDEPQSYEFIQALRLIKNEVYLIGKPIEVRYKASLSLAYPLAEIESMSLVIQESMDDMVRYIELCPSIIGLTGPLAALPTIYTDYLASRVHHAKDKAAAAFLDLFNHRLTELYVEASWFYNLPLQYEFRCDDRYLFSLTSLARQPKKIDFTENLIAYAGMIAPGRLTAMQLEHVLSKFFTVKVAVKQFEPEWFTLPIDEQTVLGVNHAVLGQSAFCGERVLQFDSKILIIFHQLNVDYYLRLLPDGDMNRAMINFIRKWCGVNLSVDIQLEIDKKYIKSLSLTESSFGALGQGGFLLSRVPNNHHNGLRYTLPSV